MRVCHPTAEYIGGGSETGGTEPSHVPREEKTKAPNGVSDSESSGERNWKSLNQQRLGL